VQTITETTNVLRMVKLFGWERNMKNRVDDKREQELKLILKRKLLELASNNANYIIPLAHMIASYATFVVVMKKPLSGEFDIYEWESGGADWNGQHQSCSQR
jgi:hypothetical protein